VPQPETRSEGSGPSHYACCGRSRQGVVDALFGTSTCVYKRLFNSHLRMLVCHCQRCGKRFTCRSCVATHWLMKRERAMESSEAGGAEPILQEASESGHTLVPDSLRGVQRWMQESRVPWTLLSVLAILIAAKALILYSLAWMLDAGLISGIHSNPYSPTDIGDTSDLILALANRWYSMTFFSHSLLYIRP
jgi:hypothetical protein